MGLLGLFKSNFTRIAENTTKYYLELRNNYSSKFSDEASLLATAGVLDVQHYIFVEGSIGLETMPNIAKDVVSKEISDLNPRRRLAAQEKHGMFPFPKRRKSPDDILHLFEEDKFEGDVLLDFVFSIEVKIFETDYPRFLRTDVELACWKKINDISDAIRKTREKYVSEPRFASVVATFMESPEFQEVRKQLGIKD